MVTPTAVIPAVISWLGAWVSSCWTNITATLICLLLLALLLDYVMCRKRSNRFPPGPTPLPFLGNLLLFDLRNPYTIFQNGAKKYGAAFSLQIGWQSYIVLNGFKMIKEAMGQKAESFADRPPVPLLKIAGYSKNCEGILLATHSNGWKEQRRFCVATLKNLGMGKKTLGKKISEEVGYLCSEFKSQEGLAFNPQKLLNNAVGNIICILIFGDRFEYSDKTFLKLMDLIQELMKATTALLPQMMAGRSLLSYVPGPHHKLKTFYNDLSAILREIVDDHKNSRDPTIQRDLIDAFLEELEKVKGNPDSSFNEQNLIKIICEWFAAGTETTSSTILWGLLKMVIHSEVQEKVHEEIEKVLGKDKAPMMEDQAKLPFTNAVIHEIQRYADITPLALPYITYEDTEVGEYVIPKETIVFSHLSSVLKDETMWEKPHQFYPEHFLDANGQFVKREAFLPFSIGKPKREDDDLGMGYTEKGRHACPGEPLAKMELFLFFTSLLQHFTFCIPENHPTPKEDRLFALTVTPAPFQICAIPR